MEKKRSLLDRLKRLFRPELKSKAEKKEKRKLLLFNRFRPKRGLPAITAPTQVTTLSEVQEAQSKHALAVAVATAAAAEAAVAAAQAAAQVVRLTAPVRPYHRDDLLPETAAIKIQTAFRGHLARKALKALKGLVKLQAMVRGQAVRRQTQTALKSLQVIVNIQSQVQASKTKIRQNKQVDSQPGKLPMQVKTGGDIKLMINCDDRRWDGSLLTKEETDSRYASKNDAANRRERIMQYGYSHQKLKTNAKNDHIREAVPVPEAECEKLPSRKNWLERWVDSQTWRRGPETEHLTRTRQVEFEKKIPHSNARNQLESPCCEHLEETQFRRRSSSPICQRRTSFHHLPKRNANTTDIDDASYTSSPAIPSYMASTASTNARTRSTSTPKERTKSWESNFHGNSPSYHRDSFPSVNSDVGSARRLTRPSSSHQRSPRLKGLTVPVKSDRGWKDLSLDSECSMPNGNKNDKNFKR